MIPDKLLNLSYTKHAIREACCERFGSIEHRPKNFIKVGCKAVTESAEKPNVIKATYIYDDWRDVILVIDTITKTVITNYLKPAQNKGVFKGRFRIQPKHELQTFSRR